MSNALLYALHPLPEGFVDVQTVIPDIVIDLRYTGKNNFIGRPIQGYNANRAILTKKAATALAAVQDDLRLFSLGLLIYDAYRPTQAVEDFVTWSKKPNDTVNKKEYYPDLSKKALFENKYITSKSSHSRGSTVDITIIPLPHFHRKHTGNTTEHSLDMGSPFDFFGELSHPDFDGITPQQKANRLLLRVLMIKHGFIPYKTEWWHFTLSDEPYPQTYFNFPIQ